MTSGCRSLFTRVNRARQLKPLAVGSELAVRAPMRLGVLGAPHLLEGDRQVEVRLRVGRVQAQRLPITQLRFGKAIDVVIDVPEVEVRLEEIGLEANRPF